MQLISENPDQPPGQAIQFEVRPGYLYARIIGQRNTLQLAYASWAAIGRECVANGHQSVLVEEQLETQLSIVDTYELAASLPGLGFWGVRTAVVDSAPKHSHDNLFRETVSINRGLRLRVFTNVAEAEAWLKSADRWIPPTPIGQ